MEELTELFTKQKIWNAQMNDCDISSEQRDKAIKNYQNVIQLIFDLCDLTQYEKYKNLDQSCNLLEIQYDYPCVKKICQQLRELHSTQNSNELKLFLEQLHCKLMFVK